jgi:hypothetical protein
MNRFQKQLDAICKPVIQVKPPVLTGIERQALEEAEEQQEAQAMWRELNIGEKL